MRLGLSSGARLSAMFASRYPKRVSKLAVLPTGDAAGASGLLDMSPNVQMPKFPSTSIIFMMHIDELAECNGIAVSFANHQSVFLAAGASI